MSERSYQGVGPGNTMGRYSRSSVERALDHHFGTTPYTGWQADGKGGYSISSGIGIIRLRTLREAWLFVIASAEKARRLDRKEVA